MSDFHCARVIKATRKSHWCEQCGKKIATGEPASYSAGSYFGDFYAIYAHVECGAAAHAFAEANGLWGDEYPCFQYMEDNDYDQHEWLLKHHPVVAERLNIKAKMGA